MHSIRKYVHHLIEHLPGDTTDHKKVDLILSGGAFNGSYLIGAFTFLKQMEEKQHIHINKISSCSTSAICSLLYFINSLDLMPDLYDIVLKQMREHNNLNVFDDCFEQIRSRIQDPIALCKDLRHKLYITYYHIPKRKKCVKSTFSTLDELFETIRKSCFMPYFIDGDLLYKHKYCDGLTPYLFPRGKYKRLYIDLLGYDKIHFFMSIKHETTVMHRILAGVLDVHLFFMKQGSTQMCSYVENWSIMQHGFYFILSQMEISVILIIYLIYLLKCSIPHKWFHHIIVRCLSMVSKELYISLIKTYCI